MHSGETAKNMELGNKRGTLVSSAVLLSVLLTGLGVGQSLAREPKAISTPTATRSNTGDAAKLTLAPEVSSPVNPPISRTSVSLTPSIDAWIAVSGALISAVMGAVLQSVFGPLMQHRLEQKRKRNEQEEAAKQAAERDQVARVELPERRAEMYNRCGEVLLPEWDAHQGIKRFSQFTADRKRDLLKEVAWNFHIDGRRYFPEAELLHLVAGFLPTIDIPSSESKAILEEIAAQYGLLKVQAHGWYGFLHLTFQEYLAALAANEKGAAGLQEVIAHRPDSWWEEVILLLAGRIHDATPLLLGLFGAFNGSAIAVRKTSSEG